jgi:hypothetical protein
VSPFAISEPPNFGWGQPARHLAFSSLEASSELPQDRTRYMLADAADQVWAYDRVEAIHLTPHRRVIPILEGWARNEGRSKPQRLGDTATGYSASVHIERHSSQYRTRSCALAMML